MWEERERKRSRPCTKLASEKRLGEELQAREPEGTPAGGEGVWLESLEAALKTNSALPGLLGAPQTRTQNLDSLRRYQVEPTQMFNKCKRCVILSYIRVFTLARNYKFRRFQVTVPTLSPAQPQMSSRNWRNLGRF